ncbi:unnamed protein product [Adineta ricciae]|uniref:Mono(ADP-ribosyl)transferase n=3 Tax=Adineta ricciae TaxID=249248 RepID=A0A814SNA5_ADIRI|nr:unnamed protein product [Adineta ricciae]
MSIFGICNLDRLEQYLNSSLTKLENLTNDNEQLLVDTIKTIDTLTVYNISLLCKPKIFSHKVFIKFRYCYNVQLSVWRAEQHRLNGYAQEVLSKVGNLFVTLSEHIDDADLQIYEEFLFEKTLIEELCLCLKNVIYYIDDPTIGHISQFIFALGRFQYNGRTLQNNSLQEDLLNAIRECLTSLWYEMCLSAEMTVEQSNVYYNCLDYVLGCSDEHYKRCCEFISMKLIKTFPRWFHEQVINGSIFHWNEQITSISSKLITILTSQIRQFENGVEGDYMDSYKVLTESLLIVLSKISTEDEFNPRKSLFIENMANLALNSYLLDMIKQTDLSQIYPYLIEKNQQTNIQMNACCLLLSTLSDTETSLLIDLRKVIGIVLKSLIPYTDTSKCRRHLIATMTHLQRGFQYETNRREFIEQDGLSRLIQFATCCKKNSFELRDMALKMICVLANCYTDDINNVVESLPEIMPGSEQEWLLKSWKLHNWNNDTKTACSSVSGTIPTHNYDPTIALKALLKQDKLIDEKHMKAVAQRHREDILLVWIYKDEDEKTLRDSIVHLRSLIHIVRIYSCLKCAEAVTFILNNRHENIFVLLHASIQRYVVRKIQHAIHIAAITVYDAPHSSTKTSTELEQTSLVRYEADFQCSVDALSIMIQSYQNQTFWFYESKQTRCADLSTESASFLWQFLLTRILNKMPPVDMNDFIDLARQWYKNNPLCLYQIDYFRKKYDSSAVTGWIFTKGSSFVQRLLQKAFKEVDMQIIWAARFFIIDLMKIIESQNGFKRHAGHITLGELMSVKRMQFLLEHQDTLLMAKGFLVGRRNLEKTIGDLQKRPRCKDSVHSILFEVDPENHCSVLVLNDEYVLFGLDVSFRICSIRYDQSLDIYRIQLRVLNINELWQNHIALLQEVGECTDEIILFGTLLADINRVPAAMDYYLSRMNEFTFDPLLNAHRLVQLGRIALRCNRTEKAENYYIMGLTLYETLLSENDPCFIRLLLDLMFVYVKREISYQAFCIYERIRPVLTEESISVWQSLLSWSQGLICSCRLIASGLQQTNQTLNKYFISYKQLNYQCTHPVLIGGLAIDIGDFAYKQGYIPLSSDCYLFAFEIANQNLPLCHPMAMASLRRQLINADTYSRNDKLTIRENRLLPLLQHSLNDINDDDNQQIADTMRKIGFEYVTNGINEIAKFYIEKCITIYRRQIPVDEVALNECQAYIFETENQAAFKFFITDCNKALHDICWSAWYRYTHPYDPAEVEEQQQIWDTALSSFFYNMTTESGVVCRSLIVWIDTRKDANRNNTLLERLIRSNEIELHVFDNVDLAVTFLLGKDFQHVRVVVANNIADAFFNKQKSRQLQTNICLTMCVFIFGIDHDDELYKNYLSSLQCSRKCWTQMSKVIERCLIMSDDDSLLNEFCTQPDIVGIAIAPMMLLVDVQAFGNMFFDEIDPMEHQVYFGSDDTNYEFIGYMSGCQISAPKLFHHLRFAKSINLPKHQAQMIAFIIFGRRHGLSSRQIASICRYFTPGRCIQPITLIKYLVRLWSLESPPFYQLVNKALAECIIEDVHLLRFIIYDYFELFNAKLLPYYVGTLYRGIQTSKEYILSLVSLIGKQIYFVCFTSTSKNKARAMVGGNTLFIIQTMSEQEQAECRIQTNVDITSVSQFSEEEEVLYAPLTTFLLLSVTFVRDPNESIKYIVKLREQASSLFYQLFMDKERFPNGTPFEDGTDMWQYKR